eukprot:12400422-Karenia_brevis.AAC.1
MMMMMLMRMMMMMMMMRLMMVLMMRVHANYSAFHSKLGSRQAFQHQVCEAWHIFCRLMLCVLASLPGIGRRRRQRRTRR